VKQRLPSAVWPPAAAEGASGGQREPFEKGSLWNLSKTARCAADGVAKASHHTRLAGEMLADCLMHKGKSFVHATRYYCFYSMRVIL
jgi:hypothetical protein